MLRVITQLLRLGIQSLLLEILHRLGVLFTCGESATIYED